MVWVKTAKWLGLGAREVVRTEQPVPTLDPVYTESRPMTGFFAGLTAEQKRAVLNYTGPENHGDPTFSKRQSAKLA
jgi:hypothetical protein